MNGPSHGQGSLATAPLLLIDGYNLLYATDIIGQGALAGTLQGSRQALLDFLAGSLKDDMLKRTIVVFDAADPPPGLPRRVSHAGMLIHYATGFPNADELVRQYIEVHDAPRQLLVISSDHAVQRAARRRRATFADSDTWYKKLKEQQCGGRAPANLPDKPTTPPSAAEVQQWLQEFGAHEESDDPSTDPARRDDPINQSTEPGNLRNPFPPGYADDLFEEDETGET